MNPQSYGELAYWGLVDDDPTGDNRADMSHKTTSGKYSYEFDEKRARGCMLDRSFPWVIRELATGKIVQYGKSEHGCQKWISEQDNATDNKTP